jgi:2,3-bisphosphoglycerate-independent phosphoglycerate mutase
MSPAPGGALVLLVGFGRAPDGAGNAVSLAEKPTFDGLWERYPHARLIAFGPAVGLPEGQMGNSEVGHLNLGAGAVVKQDLVRIDEAVEQGTIAEVDAIRDALGRVGDDRRLHLVGLVSDGGVHSSMEHLEALIRAAADAGVPDVVIHAFTDGRDTLPKNGAGYLETVEGWAQDASNDTTTIRVGTVIGRYFAMDRDQRWDRVQQAYDLLVQGDAPHHADSAAQAVRDAYDRDETDEFVTATTVGDEARIRPGDVVLVTNFRPDRVREITRALAEDGFDEIDRGEAGPGPVVAVDDYVCMTTYKADWPYPVAFPPRLPDVAPTVLDLLGIEQPEAMTGRSMIDG